MKGIKSDSDSDSDEQKKVARLFRKKIEDTLSCRPGCHPPYSDATASYVAPKPTKGSAKTRSVENLNNIIGCDNSETVRDSMSVSIHH